MTRVQVRPHRVHVCMAVNLSNDGIVIAARVETASGRSYSPSTDSECSEVHGVMGHL